MSIEAMSKPICFFEGICIRSPTQSHVRHPFGAVAMVCNENANETGGKLANSCPGQCCAEFKIRLCQHLSTTAIAPNHWIALTFRIGGITSA
jgi:hypothetical protein